MNTVTKMRFHVFAKRESRFHLVIIKTALKYFRCNNLNPLAVLTRKDNYLKNYKREREREREKREFKIIQLVTSDYVSLSKLSVLCLPLPCFCP